MLSYVVATYTSLALSDPQTIVALISLIADCHTEYQRERDFIFMTDLLDV